MAIKELSDQNPSGTRLGYTSSDLIAFYGATPVVQPSSALQAAASVTTGTALTTTVITTASTSTAPFGFTSTVADVLTAIVDTNRVLTNVLLTRVTELIAGYNRMRVDLVALGLIKGSA